MGWFLTKKVPYQDLVIGAINKGMAIRIKDEKVFDGFQVNNLEAVVAIFWMVESSLRGLPRPKVEKAGSYLMEETLAWLGNDYSGTDISRLVIPLFEKRLNEYSAQLIARPGEKEQAPFLRTFKRVVENVFAEDEAHIARIMASIVMWWRPISEEGARITALDKKGEVKW